MCKKIRLGVFIFLLTKFNLVHLENAASGDKRNLRLCVLEKQVLYTNRDNKQFCSMLHVESGVECVFAVDKLDCLRRISSGAADFGSFSPEELVAAQWADKDILITNQLKIGQSFKRNIVALINRRILPEQPKATDVSALLKNRGLCYPVGISRIDLNYLESLLMTRNCDPNLTLFENTVKSRAEFFSQTCQAGEWVEDETTDANLKRKYPSMCAGCASTNCSVKDLYWGSRGALTCMEHGGGDVTWVDKDELAKYTHSNRNASSLERFSIQFLILCRDGSLQPILNNPEPCVWLQEPWPVIAANRKSAAAVGLLTSSLNSNPAADRNKPLAELLDTPLDIVITLQPPQPLVDYLANASGYREAHSRHSCDPPRYITFCTTSAVAYNKCQWLAEAGNAVGVEPPLRCTQQDHTTGCLRAVRDGESDVTVADSDWLVPAQRNYALEAVLHEANSTINDANVAVAYVRKDANISKMAELRGKRVSFPRFDGAAFHSVLRYLKNRESITCRQIVENYFSEICAPGIEEYSVTDDVKEMFTRNCYKEGGKVEVGESQALRALMDGKSDVAFVSNAAYNSFKAQHRVDFVRVCPEESEVFCFISWWNVGHVFARKDITSIRRHEIIDALTGLDSKFGSIWMTFSMYEPYDHQTGVLFHHTTEFLFTNDMYKMSPYDKTPLSFERAINDICQIEEITQAHTA